VATLFKKGSAGSEVAELQSKLAAAGFSAGPVDGQFGSLTEQAVLAFQTAKGLAADGVVGPETSAALGLDDPPTAGSLLVQLGLIAEERFGLNVHECDAPGAPARWAPVGSGHSPNSFHHRGRAFDASGSKASADAFAAFVATNHGSEVAELIHNPNGSIKDGVRVPSDFWPQATFDVHQHCHVAV
jgi:hypothetical protein